MANHAIINTGNYEIIYINEELRVINLKTGEEFDEEYFLSIEQGNAKEHDFNLLLNTYDLIDRLPRKHMTNELMKRLNDLHSHLSNLGDTCMGKHSNNWGDKLRFEEEYSSLMKYKSSFSN